MTPEPCGGCGKTVAEPKKARCPIVTVAMAPGRDGKAWWMCVRCWSDGIKSKAHA